MNILKLLSDSYDVPSIPSYLLQADWGFLRKLSEFVGKPQYRRPYNDFVGCRA